jgi:hypothetical protein
MSARLLSVTPMIPAGSSLAEELVFYTEHMGFAVAWQDGGMAGIERDGVSINLVENTSREWAENSSFSIGVSDLEGLYQEYRSIPAKVGPLEPKAWGRREFHLIVPSGVCLQFYEHPDA